MSIKLLVGNDQTIQALGIRNESTGAYINDAVVTVTIYKKNRTEVAGETWPLSLTYVPASNGDYSANLEDGIEFEAGKSYWVEVTAEGTGDAIAFWKEIVPAINRSFSE